MPTYIEIEVNRILVKRLSMKYAAVIFTAVLILGCSAVNTKESAMPVEPKIKAALLEFDKEFDTCFEWWGNIYDPQSGGFFYSLSAKNNPEKYRPYIEGTSKGIKVLKWTGILNKAPDKFKKGVIRYYQSRQDPESGFFKDPQFIGQYSHNALSRALGMSTGDLELLGAKPLYPLPYERTGENEEARKYYEHMQSPEKLTAWLDTLPWDQRTWTVGGRILAQSGNFDRLAEPLKTEMLKTITEYIQGRQSDNGFWIAPEKRDWASELSGSYKLASFFDKHGFPVPKAEEMKKTVLHHLFNSEYRGLIVLYNTVNVLSILERHTGGFDTEMKVKIIRKATDILKTMHGPDGGFVTTIGQAKNKPQGLKVAANVVESNTNSTGLAHKTRMLLYQMTTGQEGPFDHPRSGDFIEALKQQSR